MNVIKRLQAARCVSKLRSAQALPPDELTKVKAQLLNMGDEAVPAVLDCLGHGVARGPALEVLQGLLNEDTVSFFVEGLGSTNPAIASGAGKVLSENNAYDPTLLLELLSDERIPKANVEAVLRAQTHRLRPRLILRSLEIAGKEEKGILLRLLEACVDETVVVDLVDFLSNDDWLIRLYMAKLLAGFPGTTTTSGLVRALKDKNREVRLEAVHSLGALEAKGAIVHLVRLLRDGDLKVQTAAIDAVTRLGDASTVPALLEVLKDESEHSRRAAVEVLNEIATTEAVQDLVRAMRDEDWWVRVRAADALGALGGDRVVEAVVGCLGDEDDFIRRYAVEILNTVTGERAVEPLVRALDDPDWWVKERAVDALGRTGDSRAVEPLIRLLEKEREVAHLCARALGELGDTRAVKPLRRLAANSEGETRDVAEDALRALGRLETGASETSSPKSDRGLVSLESERSTPTPEAGASRVVSRSESDEAAHPEIRGEPPSGGKRPAIVTPDQAGPVHFHDLPPDTVLLDRYRVIRKVGVGGFGTVYLVNDTAIQEEVILKILNPQMSADPNGLRRFVRELKLTRRITHANVIRIHDFLDLGGIHAVSMEYFHGGDLGDLLKRTTTLPLKRALAIAEQAARGLVAAHEEGVIHRDIKPANVLVDEEDRVKIVDFGLALAGAQLGSRLTQSGLLIGTPEYMAPEQIRGGSVDHRADLYALGIILYEMLSGRQPFTGETPVKILFQHLEGEAPDLTDIAEEVPISVGFLVSATMAREPENRPQTASALVEMIEDARRGLAA